MCMNFTRTEMVAMLMLGIVLSPVLIPYYLVTSAVAHSREKSKNWKQAASMKKGMGRVRESKRLSYILCLWLH